MPNLLFRPQRHLLFKKKECIIFTSSMVSWTIMVPSIWEKNFSVSIRKPSRFRNLRYDDKFYLTLSSPNSTFNLMLKKSLPGKKWKGYEPANLQIFWKN